MLEKQHFQGKTGVFHILVNALKSYVRSGQLPPLPTKITANG